MNAHKKTLNFMQLLSNFKINHDINELKSIFKNAAKILGMDRIILYENINKDESKVITLYSSCSHEKLKKDLIIKNKDNVNINTTLQTKKRSSIPVPNIGEDIAVVIHNNKYIITGDDIDEARSTSKLDHIYFDFLAKATENAIDILEAKLSIRKLLVKAFTDKLTKTLNRAALDEHVDYNKDIQSNQYNSKPVGVLFIDIDHFKIFNDLHGHAAGDKVLIEVFKTIKNITKNNSIVYRYGGEEIAVIVLSGNPEVIAEKCRKAIEKMIIVWNDMELNVKISIGVSINENTGLACKYADHALYYSKENGRNMVSLYSEKIKNWFFLREKVKE